MQFAARLLALALNAIELGNPLSTKDVVSSLVMTLRTLPRTSNSLLRICRDNVRPALQMQLKHLARKDGNRSPLWQTALYGRQAEHTAQL